MTGSFRTLSLMAALLAVGACEGDGAAATQAPAATLVPEPDPTETPPRSRQVPRRCPRSSRPRMPTTRRAPRPGKPASRPCTVATRAIGQDWTATTTGWRVSDPATSMAERRRRLNERLRAAFIEGAELDSRRRLGRGANPGRARTGATAISGGCVRSSGGTPYVEPGQRGCPTLLSTLRPSDRPVSWHRWTAANRLRPAWNSTLRGGIPACGSIP